MDKDSVVRFLKALNATQISPMAKWVVASCPLVTEA
jgi:hypothetical protein